MLPRRSSRAQVSQASSHTSRQANSESSPSSAGRDRPNRSTGQNSQPIDPSYDNEDNETMETTSSTQRRSRRQAKKSEPSTPIVPQPVSHLDDVDEGTDGADGSIRCVCGFEEFPGMPLIPIDRVGGRIKSKGSPALDEGHTTMANPEVGNQGEWFIQCDKCEAWQHGACLGIASEASAPQSYLCEQCGPSSHSLGTDVNGQHYSIYAPPGKKKSKLKSEPTWQVNSSPLPNGGELHTHLKRRSTMNSRLAADGADDELFRALEESKQDAPGAAEEAVSRGTKRSRDESTESTEPQTKKRRTSIEPAERALTRSASQSSSGSAARTSNPEISEPLSSRTRRKVEPAPKSPTKAAPKSKSKPDPPSAVKRTAATTLTAVTPTSNNSNSTIITANGKSKDGAASGASPAPPSRTTSTRATAKAKDKDITPPNSAQGPISAPPSRTKGKNGGNGARRGRVGRNQYSRDLLPPEDEAGMGMMSRSASPGSASKRPQRSRAGSSYRTSGLGNGVGVHGNEMMMGNGAGGGGGAYRPRSKQVNLNRWSLNEMKKRVAVIGDFVGSSSGSSVGAGAPRGDEAGGAGTSPGSGSGSSLSSGGGGGGVVGGLGVGSGSGGGGSADMNGTGGGGGGVLLDLETFRLLSTEQMKEYMMGAVDGWQKQFGKWGER